MKVNRYLPGAAGIEKNSTAVPAAKKQHKTTAFTEILQDTLSAEQKLKFSAHARQRLQERQINLQTNDLDRINQALQAAEKKGVRSTLMLYQDLALIASVTNKTIITAMKGDDLREHIFTNIDSAVIIR